MRLLPLFVALAMLAVAVPALAQSNESSEDEEPSWQVAWLSVSGMSCPFCAKTVEEGLHDVEGVSFARAWRSNESALVVYDARVASADGVLRAPVFQDPYAYRATLVREEAFTGELDQLSDEHRRVPGPGVAVSVMAASGVALMASFARRRRR